MNLTHAIHQRWAAAQGLNALLPSARLFTGVAADPRRPYAVVSQESNRPLECANDGASFSAVGLRIRTFHENHDEAASIATQIKAAFDRSSFALSGDDRVVDMRLSDELYRQNDDGAWELVLDFNCTVLVFA
jgi:hypothetical protein